MGGAEPVIADAVRYGDLIFMSGRAPVDPATLQVAGDGFAEQAQIVLRDIGAVLAAAGSAGITCCGSSASWPTRPTSPSGTGSGRAVPARRARRGRRSSRASRCPGMLIELQVTAAAAELGA